MIYRAPSRRPRCHRGHIEVTARRDNPRRGVADMVTGRGEPAGQRRIGPFVAMRCHGSERAHNPEVAGSNPALATTRNPWSAGGPWRVD
jgi:hypothetical protein